LNHTISFDDEKESCRVGGGEVGGLKLRRCVGTDKGSKENQDKPQLTWQGDTGFRIKQHLLRGKTG